MLAQKFCVHGRELQGKKHRLSPRSPPSNWDESAKEWNHCSSKWILQKSSASDWILQSEFLRARLGLTLDKEQTFQSTQNRQDGRGCFMLLKSISIRSESGVSAMSHSSNSI